MKVQRSYLTAIANFTGNSLVSANIPQNAHILDIVAENVTDSYADVYLIHTAPDYPVYSPTSQRQFAIVSAYNVTPTPNEYSMYVGKVTLLPPLTASSVSSVTAGEGGMHDHIINVNYGVPHNYLIFETGENNG